MISGNGFDDFAVLFAFGAIMGVITKRLHAKAVVAVSQAGQKSGRWKRIFD